MKNQHPSSTDAHLLAEAEKKVNAKKGFYWHLIVYVACGIFFFLMNMMTSPHDIWFPFPMVAWGLGLFFHGIGVFGIPGLNVLGQDWEKKQLDKEIEKLREKKKRREDLLLLESEEDILNINERDYIRIQEMRKKGNEFE